MLLIRRRGPIRRIRPIRPTGEDLYTWDNRNSPRIAIPRSCLCRDFNGLDNFAFEGFTVNETIGDSDVFRVMDGASPFCVKLNTAALYKPSVSDDLEQVFGRAFLEGGPGE